MLATSETKIRPIDDIELAAATGGTTCVSAFGWSACGFVDDKGFGGSVGGHGRSWSFEVTVK